MKDNFRNILVALLLRYMEFVVGNFPPLPQGNSFQQEGSPYGDASFAEPRQYSHPFFGQGQSQQVPDSAASQRQFLNAQRQYADATDQYFATPAVAGGPNRCDGGRSCCPGWTMNPSTRLCTLPICRFACGFGICRSPNLCQCIDGQFNQACGGQVGTSGCPQLCLNGGQCEGQRCSCPAGYVGEDCSQPICSEPCVNNGRCIGPDRCACPYGFTGRRCEEDHRVGPCFTRIETNMCRGQLLGVKCSRESCCATVGLAWGIPCDKCPEKRDCERGYYKNPATGQCEDINECRGIPNICAMGTCINTVGSYTCACGNGRRYNAEKFECSDINECDLVKGLCAGGTCENLDGGFKCVCPSGFTLSESGRRCIAPLTSDLCYRDFTNGQCSTPSPRDVNKRVCCCGHPQRAFGDCRQCPAKGTDEYAVLGCPDDPDPVIPAGGGDNTGTGGTGAGSVGTGTTTGTGGTGSGSTGAGGTGTGGIGSGGIGTGGTGTGGTGSGTSTGGTPGSGNEDCSVFGLCPGSGSTGSGGKGTDAGGTGGTTGTGGGRPTGGSGATGGTSTDGGDVVTGTTDESTKTVGTGEDGDKKCAGLFASCDNGRCHVMNGRAICICDQGYVKNRDNFCADLNECAKFPGLCQGGQCLNTAGGFRCQCRKGYESSEDKLLCRDVDECLDKTKCVNGKCMNFPGTFQCRCNEGFVSAPEGDTCVDIDECTSQANACPDGVCVNTPGAYRCDCKPGYNQTGEKECVDIDECRATPGLCNGGYCVNVGGSFKCVCPKGYTLSPDGLSCQDRDECALVKDICFGGKCINGPGSYRCQCDFGFEVSSDGTYCRETRIDECYAKYNGLQCSMPLMKQLTRMECCCGMENTGMRAFGRKCESCPEKGTDHYKLVCRHGSGMIGEKEDIDECKNNAGMTFGICEHGTCSNMMGDYKCVCIEGFKNHESSNKICEDIDECANEICKGGQCTNTIGGFTCKCPQGYFYNRNSQTCEDVDECRDNPCTGGYCKNTPGSYACDCPPETVKDDRLNICIDRREGRCFKKIAADGTCDKPNAGFVSKSECCNSVGHAWGPKCEKCDRSGSDKTSTADCPAGHKRVGTVCQDINECAKFDDVCPNGRCINTQGSYRCVCPTGYELDPSGTECIDMRLGLCFRHVLDGQCGMPFGELFKKQNCCCSSFSQAWGSPCEICPLRNSDAYEALCPAGKGFTKNGEDMNECEVAGICKNGKCTNTLGSYKCECDSGFDMDSTNTMCVDIDECEISNEVCGNGQCVNTHGSFRCQCDDGYRNDMMMEMCVDINECQEGDPPPCAGGQCVNSPGSFQCICPKGMRTMGAAVACEDVDECTEQPDICPHGTCQNFIGGYHCRCNRGFRESRDMLQCIDIDECNVDNGGCEYSCRNTPGSFVCGCQPGFELAEDKKACVDINECTRGNPCGEGNSCSNFVGGHVCTCRIGFRASLDAKACVDIDECSEDPNACRNGQCINTAGTFLCQCALGYSLERNAMVCIDIDECKLQPNGGCHPDARCINNVGSFTCQCNPGFDGDGSTCNDVNECELGQASCAQDAECVNTVGSFVCQCRKGFSGDGEICVDINECLEDATLCTPGQCVNTIGGFKCECDAGYKPSRSGRTCIDVNECEDQALAVCEHGYCINTIGSFTCQCMNGFQLDRTKTNCVDVDECEVTGMCFNGVCENMMGMYKCICNQAAGFVPNVNQTSCVDKRMGYCYSQKIDNRTCGGAQLTARPMMKQDCCCTAPDGSAWQDDDTEQCEACPRMSDADYKKLCPGGTSTTTDESGKISKHDGCQVLVNYCKGGTCIETGNRGISCLCPAGHRFNAETLACEDVDECQEVVGICGYGAQCVNTAESYRCQCADGQTYDSLQNFCRDVRPQNCFLSVMNPDGKCTLGLPTLVTVGKCCCGGGLPSRYGAECKMCPSSGSADWEALCIGKPTVPPIVTGQPPIGPTSPPPSTSQPDPEGKGDGKDGGSGTGGTGTDGKGTGSGGTGGTGSGGTGSGGTGTDGKGTGGTGTGGTGEGTGTGGTGSGGTGTGTGTGGTGTGGTGTGGTGTGGTGTGGTGAGGTGTDGKGTGGSGTGGSGTGGTGGTGGDGGDGGKVQPTIDPSNDIDECVYFPTICGKGSCVNLIGGYRCACEQGYEQATINGRVKCVDADECKANPCEEGMCTNIEGAFYCTCEETMRLDESGRKCVDLNECSTAGYCENGECANLIKGFTCTCNKGYTKTVDGKTCEDMDECVMPGLCGNGTCVNTKGGYDCRCNRGFKKNAAGKCDDLDECFEYPDLCRHGQCINLYGSFMCECNAGFKQDSTKQSCQDINECTLPGFCANGRCRNTIGGAVCTCNEGYEKTRDGLGCEDVNECLDPDNHCQYGGECINTNGGFRCLCKPGFVTDLNSRACVDVRRSFCFSALEGSTCTLPNGLNITKSMCCCSMGAGWGDPCELCPEKSSKEFEYYCPNGVGLNKDNTDINECEANLGACKNSKCVNTDGSFMCDCHPGYKKTSNPLACTDTNECSEMSNACGFGNCTNLEGSFACKCEKGFRPGKVSPACEDINECKEQSGLCAFRCENLVGSYRCVCPRGFKLAADGKRCEDIDECETPFICPFQCKNLVGGYRCLCLPGYKQSARGDCFEINECLENPNLCRPGGFCQNIEGSYRCDCVPPFMRSADGLRCEDKSMGLCFANTVDGVCEAEIASKKMEKVSQRDCCCSQGGSAWGAKCTLCPDFGTSAERSLCTGYQNKSINECAYIANVCKNGKCMDTPDSFRCMCNSGFKLAMSGKRCEDVDECADPTLNNCGGGCRNTEGSYECVCKKGYIPSTNKTSCVDEDECQTGRHDCEHECYNTDGGFKCMCPHGYKRHGKGCADIDECAEDGGVCGIGTCRNVPGSYECICQRGLTFDKDKKSCVYIDPGTGPGTGTGTGAGPGSGCLPQSGCGCGPGYYPFSPYFNPFGPMQCVDVNECLQNMCGQASCTNMIGSYRCSCPGGFNFQGGRCVDTNECNSGFGTNGSPCLYGCQNSNGGFACKCPPGFHPVQGGTCVATYGVACYSCDTSDIPSEGVPLQGAAPIREISRHQSAIGDASVPLSGAGRNLVPPFNSQFYPRQIPTLGQFGGSYQQYGFQGGSLYQAFPPQQAYPYGDYSYRTRRSVRKRVKPSAITISAKTKPSVALIKLAPMLAVMQEHMEYAILSGNTTLFELQPGEHGVMLHATRFLPSGTTHYLTIIGSLKKNGEAKEKDLELMYRDARKFQLKVIIHVV